ncbi:CoA-binding protein [Pseudoruegeria sp. SHC-113]|uniref:CoA-binding protein n=1 Tax=Pseudoruegeria sp. SHC-113 TaxID=2855439 RepID=UPI0021BB1BF2|nr:CoA-binding protein [Pseudoruegeria sp. SHC-113]MCT8159859.1 CoA-binding protein [Pseudoruegeria sp. SHC-113]
MVSDDQIRQALLQSEVIACVGASANPARPSHYVSQFLTTKGKRVIGVNPGLAGQELFGAPVYGRLSDIPAEEAVTMIDIFRRPEQILPIVEEAIAALPALKVVWMQLGIENAEAAALAQGKGLTVVQNRCPKIEWPRLIG